MGSNIPTPPKSHSTNFVALSTENSSLISEGSTGNQKYEYKLFKSMNLKNNAIFNF